MQWGTLGLCDKSLVAGPSALLHQARLGLPCAAHRLLQTASEAPSQGMAGPSALGRAELRRAKVSGSQEKGKKWQKKL